MPWASASGSICSVIDVAASAFELAGRLQRVGQRLRELLVETPSNESAAL